MFYSIKSRSKSEKKKGQGLTEYALLLSLIAIVVIVALGILKPQIGNVFSQISWAWASEAGDAQMGTDEAAEGPAEANEGPIETRGSILSKQITAIMIIVAFIVVAVNLVPLFERFVKKRH